jgi:hypothetical protein
VVALELEKGLVVARLELVWVVALELVWAEEGELPNSLLALKSQGREAEVEVEEAGVAEVLQSVAVDQGVPAVVLGGVPSFQTGSFPLREWGVLLFGTVGARSRGAIHGQARIPPPPAVT